MALPEKVTFVKPAFVRLTLERLRSVSRIEYDYEGIAPRETLNPIRYDDGELAWQITRDGELVGVLDADGISRSRHAKTAEWTWVTATAPHLAALARSVAPHRSALPTVLLDGVAWLGIYADDWEPQLASSLVSA